MNRAVLGWVIVFVTACGSGTPPAKASGEDQPKPIPASSSGEAEPPSAVAEALAPSAAPEAPPEEAHQEPLSPADLTAVLQAVLDDPELDGYLHLEKPGRSPVKLAGANVPKDVKLVKGKHPVTIVEGPKSDKDPVLLIQRIKQEGGVATVAYQYDVEHIRGTTRVKNGKTGWELVSSRIIEK
jgi:hypothetical protein